MPSTNIGTGQATQQPRSANAPIGSQGNGPHRPFQPAPEIQSMLDELKKVGNDLDALTAESIFLARSIRDQRAESFLWYIPVEAVTDLPNAVAKSPVRARLYVPHDKQLARDGKLPVVVFFHGGGWTMGSPTLFDPVTRQLARQIPALVISVDYRLAPEAPFPAAVFDADAIVQWVRDSAEDIGGDPKRIVVVGDSAGATLATVSALHARTKNGPPILMQVLFYPSTNISSMDYDSYVLYGEDHLLTKNAVTSFRNFYLPREEDRTSPDASPLLAEDLRGLPSTLIIAAGCDPLRDEGYAYFRKLQDQGIHVAYHLEPQLIHAFLNLYNLDPACSPYAEAALGYAAGAIRRELAQH